ncbi:iron chelate uptake ABC transporter family permease subunit [Anaerosalibacter massiliensis]|uniref:Iron chelate uptake ABC transporter family permease subunit n=1 Tax=Anaerosalibacter massiliensis TaxID=1347392 RepID=A0A9X2MKM0_9FIRM|nr:iron chelate uptake ABC transporter family permease subunit [Anaerosalibacter massiliensis]MCR2044877.1 iron chelate uptake ABC transporter family permease subunit [Anaerosalibacter massiliensis]
MDNKRKISFFIIISTILILIFIFSGLNSNNKYYFLSKRIPKVIAIIITGVSIAFSSMVFQTITNNRILTPSILGLDSLYIFIQTFIIFVLGSGHIIVTNNNLNFILSGSLMIFFSALVYKFLFKKNQNDILFLLLAGLILGSLFQSLSSFMQMLIDPNEFLHVQDIMFASFNNINVKVLWISSLLVFILTIYTYKYTEILDVLSLGKEQSINLGINYDDIVKRMLIVVSLLISVSTALVGPITFLGLLVVNLAREFLSTFKHRYLMAVSGLISIVALLGGQLLVERVFNFSTPISVIINFIGGLYFIYLLIKENKI